MRRRPLGHARRLVALLAALLAGGCADGWRPLPEEARPTAAETVSDGLVHVVTPRGLDRLAAAAWVPLAVRYGDGIVAPIEQHVLRHDDSPLAVYGPGRVVVQPTGVTLVREDGGVTAVLALGDARATLSLRTWRAAGQELACTVRATLKGASYRFAVSTIPDGGGAVRVDTKTPGTLSEESVTLTTQDCAFTLTSEHETAAIGRARGALWTALDEEWAGPLGDATRDALAARLDTAGLLAVPSDAGDEAAGRLALVVTPTRALAPAGDGLATWYGVGIAASGPVCDGPSSTAGTLATEVALPLRPVAPDGAPYDEALVLTRPLLERALDAAQRAGLLSGRLPAAGDDESGAAAALAALWPAETPAEVARLRSDRFSVRLRLAGDAAGSPVFEVQSAPPAGGSAWAPLRLRVGRLRLGACGGLDDLEVRLFSLDASGVTLDLVPSVDADGLVRLRVTSLEVERLESVRGLLSLPNPGAAWIKLLLDAALAEQPLLDLGTLSGPVPVLAGTEWLQGGSYVLYLRRPDPTRSDTR